MEYPDLAEVERRPKRYWNLDGIPEIVMGGLWIVWGVAFLLPDFLPRGSRLAGLFSMIVPLLLVASGLTANWVTKMLKKKYTFPRGGYVKFHDPTHSQQLFTAVVGGLVAVVFAAMIALSVRHQAIAEVSAPAIGVLMAGGFLVASMRPGLRHFVWFSILSLVLGAALYPLKLEWMALPWFFTGIGVALAAVGVCRFRAFVRSVSLPGGNEP